MVLAVFFILYHFKKFYDDDDDDDDDNQYLARDLDESLPPGDFFLPPKHPVPPSTRTQTTSLNTQC